MSDTLSIALLRLRRTAKLQRLSLEGNPADDALNRLLRQRALRPYRFVHRHKIRHFVVDYYSKEAKVAVEIDHGAEERHARRAKEEAERRTILGGLGIRLLRFAENDILERPDCVRSAILELLA